MLDHTFRLVPGIGGKIERRLWDAGIGTWDRLLAAADPPLALATLALARDRLAEARARLAAGDAEWFARLLATDEQWRLFYAFGDAVGYLDIETTGIGGGADHITAIALYDGSQVRTFVHGINLHEFEQAVAGCKLIVTFNGKCFDVPIIERELRIELPRAHIDLRYLLRSLGYQGGLKRIEKRFDIGRDELDGVDGYFAVLLWWEYRNGGNPAALETLLAYNAADVIGLETLLVHACNQKLKRTPFFAELVQPLPRPPANPHRADAGLIAALRQRHFPVAGAG
ncbi:MAG: ribonuclease H-like domain-containing protein [Deltaproteobacteria bacterium]|nr:ribonuclease H-like domain-containing protein [Deltaproteobacteria bacterium]